VEPKIVAKPASKIVGYELKTTCREGKHFQEIPAFWANLEREQSDMLNKTLRAVHHNKLGIYLPPDSTTDDFSYVIALEVYNYEGVVPDMFRGELPGATYAVFIVLPVESLGTTFSGALQGTWQYIYTTWFPGSDYEFDERGVEFELYYEATKVEIYIPVVKKREDL